ncbi:MAG: MBL fold metallo-hydrolase, partial [Verrucomicrobiota bacterium]
MSGVFQLTDDCLELRGHLVHHHALLEPGRIVLIDSGFLLNTPKRTDRLLREVGRSLDEVSDIILSHGHIDHVLHAAALKRKTGAKIWAPRLDRDRLAGVHRNESISKLGGLLEGFARALFRYEPPEIDNWFEAGDTLPLYGGLEVIPLPGHTSGHCGLYQRDREMLFAADLFASLY